MKNYIPKTFRQILAMLLCVAMVLPMAAVPGYATEVTEPTVSVIAETQPETTVPETTAPEATVPETTVPETTAPEATVPETTVPETTAPEATVPETTESEESVPETTAPEVSEERPMMMMMSSGKSPLAVVYAASDFQPYKYDASNTKVDDVDGGMDVMNAIIDTMQTTGHTNVNGALFCGDYSNRADTWGHGGVEQNNAGQAAVAKVLSEQWQLGDDQVVYVQGNHDPANTNGLDPSGNNDTANYGVFVIHEDDFQWKQGDYTSDEVSNSGNSGNTDKTTQQTAAALERYLKEKAEQKYNKPIFVCAHVPLHFGWRTAEESLQDNIYAKYIFDVLNKYGEKLDIIYLFGHDHSDTYDDYLGGAAVYLPVGAEIWIPDTGSRSTWSPYKLTFTYMNAGYLGYYGGKVFDSDGSLEADTGMSSTIFAIYEDKVVISRFDEDSLENLKNKGEKTSDDTWSGAAANKDEYASSQTIKLKQHTPDLNLGTLASGILAAENSATISVAGVYGATYEVTWSSNAPEIAEVAAGEDNSMNAIVTAKKPGNVKITAQVTEAFPTRAAGETFTLDVNLEIVDSSAGAVVPLLEAGTYNTYYRMTDELVIGETYMIIDIENEGSLIGQQQAIEHTGEIDTGKEGDTQTNGAQEINAAGQEVIQLPVNGEILTLANAGTTVSRLWNVEAGGNSGYYKIKNYVGRAKPYLFVGEGDSDYIAIDSDMDRVNTEASVNTAGGGNWVYDPKLGLRCNTKADGFQYVLYYSQAQRDFSAYRVNHNGTSEIASTFEYTGGSASPMHDEQANSRVYLFVNEDLVINETIYAQLNDTTGYVNKDVGYTSSDGQHRLGGAQTGDKIILTQGDFTLAIPVTIDMLSGDFDVTKPDTYTGLTVTYAGVVIATDYTLVVRNTATLLKNDAAREYMDTIYTLTDTMVPGKQYLIVDSNTEGVAHAMGVANDKVTAHNVRVQKLPVGGKDMLFIDSSRYGAADLTATELTGRGIADKGNINAYFTSAENRATEYQKAIRLVWTPTQRMFTTDGSPEYYDARLRAWFYVLSQMQISKEDPNRLLAIQKNEENWDLILRADPAGGNEGDGDSNNGTADRWWEQWQYQPNNGGLQLPDNQTSHAYLFYNWQNVIGDNNTEDPANKNFQTETDLDESGFSHKNHRRVWLYEQVTNIDTISARLSDNAGSVVEDKNASAATGDYILVDTTHADGTVTTTQVPITVSMLSGENLNLHEPDTYENLTVTYQGVIISQNYDLKVTKLVEVDNPEFPNEGAVKIDKQLDTTKYEYLNTGAASIDLSVTGIPAQTGVDLVVVLDTSSSMQRCPHHIQIGDPCDKCNTTEVGEEHTRMVLLENTLEEMLAKLKEPIDGYTPDIDLAIVTFNGYTSINSDYEFWYDGVLDDEKAGDELTHGEGQQNTEDRPDASVLLQAFTNIKNIAPDKWNTDKEKFDIPYSPGTNYDRAMERAYDLLKAKQDQNALNNTTRDAIVVFMSDGAPYQFNYFHGDSNMKVWDEYLNGRLTDSSTCVTKQSDAVKAVFAKYNNSEGKHWMAEAIKADPNTKVKVIDPDANTVDCVTTVNGLGATMYTVGFGLVKDHMVSIDTMNAVLERMATTNEHFNNAANGEELTRIFLEIANKIRKAGNAAFTDQMGPEFDLITSNKVNDGKITLNPAPSIIVKQYELYKRSEIGQTLEFENEDGTTTSVTVTEKMVGTRKPVEPHIIETVTFSDDGSAAYSDQRDINGDGVCNTLDNILENNGKVIHAATFWYNKDIQNEQNITVNGKTVALERECFYWNVGDIPQDELVLSYDVYLSGSMEGTRNAGSYKTNAHAELNYTNYLNHPCELTVPTPMLPWKQATVGYGFYLVDDQGNPIINQDTGETGSFEQSIKITQPVYQDFLLNSGTQNIIADIVANENLPDGYTLFDQGAKYQVSLESNGDGMYILTATREDGVQTTYVVGVESTAVTGGDADGDRKETKDFATANTIVWFGVVANVQCVPDTVVVDFGLPVDINVLANDTMMGSHGKVQYVGKTDPFADGYETWLAVNADKTLPSRELWAYLQTIKGDGEADITAETLEGTYGKLGILKNEKAETTGELRYTLNDAKAVADAAAEGKTILNGMQMKEEETFVYAVNYTGDEGAKGYYYSTVTVIPATTIYYEDSFVTFKVKDYKTTDDLNETWETAGEKVDATQAEDRPGEFSLSDLDANNIYGYDAAYKNMTKYSLGSAKMVNVQTIYNSSNMRATGGKYATAEFTFWGTGFDVISLTSAKTGTIVVQVTGISDAVTNVSKNYVVDTYYGYKYENGKWVVNTNDKETDGNDLYQIPVMKVEDLPYGQYKAVITASHAELFDHKQYEAEEDKENGTITMSYDFYLDAIRIYDPANDGVKTDGTVNETIQNAYKDDGEGWPEYFELRDLLISANTFAEAAANNNTVAGIIFIDGNATLGAGSGSNVPGDVTDNLDPDTTPVVKDYANYGPNNELYLAPGQAVAFKMEIGTKRKETVDGVEKEILDTSNIAGIHIALKGVGKNVQAKIHNAAVDTSKVPYSNVGTATDLYYDIAQLNGKTLVIYNSLDSKGILSITNIKVTYKTEHADGIENAFFTASQPDANLAAACLMMARPKPVEPDVTEPEETTPETTAPGETTPETTVPEETTPETTVPEETVPETTAPAEPEEPETFEPRKFNVQLSAGSVKVGSNVIVTVTTGTDVDHITVNGEEVSRYTANRWTKTRTWQVKVKAETAGEQTVEVICYNADAVASAPVVKTVTVTEQYTSVSNWLTDVVTGIIGSLLGKWR